MEFDLAMTDELLTTTRAVRKRLDLDREVPRAVIVECLELAVQAPTGSNSQGWRWLIVDDPEPRQQLADLYRQGAAEYLELAGEQTLDPQTQRVFESSVYLTEVLHHVPVHVIPCMAGRPPEDIHPEGLSGYFGSIFPAIWSFQLALRARGLGSVLTTLHLIHAEQAATLLGIPDDVMQVALLPVAYTLGTDFQRAKRRPISKITHFNQW
jgi:nitroreductase